MLNLHTLKIFPANILIFDVSSYKYFKWKKVLFYLVSIHWKYQHAYHASFSSSSWNFLLGSFFSVAWGKLFGAPFNGSLLKDVLRLYLSSCSFDDNLFLGGFKIFISFLFVFCSCTNVPKCRFTFVYPGIYYGSFSLWLAIFLLFWKFLGIIISDVAFVPFLLYFSDLFVRLAYIVHVSCLLFVFSYFWILC